MRAVVYKKMFAYLLFTKYLGNTTESLGSTTESLGKYLHLTNQLLQK